MAQPDPLRALSREPVSLTVAGHPLVFPWRPAIDWIEVIRHDPGRLVAELAEDSGELVIAMALGDVAWNEVEAASRELLSAETGDKWWTVLKLVYSSASGGVLGELTLSGVDPARVSLGQWCAAVYRVLTRNAEDKDRMRIDFELELPPPGYESSWDDGNDYNAMVEMARQYGQTDV